MTRIDIMELGALAAEADARHLTRYLGPHIRQPGDVEQWAAAVARAASKRAAVESYKAGRR
jgi:hypothetical protein